METHTLTPENLLLREKLRRLKPRDKVSYTDWRGGSGEGFVLRFISHDNKEVDPKDWGYDNRDVIVIKRNDSADDGRYFRPFLKDGDTVTPVVEKADGVSRV
jgi:hypothetical protein